MRKLYYLTYGIMTYTLTYGDNAKANPLGQFSHCLAEAYDAVLSDFTDLCFVGFFGKPSKKFPTEIKIEEADSEGYDMSQTFGASYLFNSDGTLMQEYFMYSYYDYLYSSVGDDNDSPSVSPDERKAPIKKVRRHALRHLRDR